MRDNPGKQPGDGGVAESGGTTDIELLLAASGQADISLSSYKSKFTLLFVDVVGSPAFFERYGETAVLVMLQQQHEMIIPAIREAGGEVVKSVGDTALTLFGTAGKAAKTAIRIQQKVEKYNRKRPENERSQVRIALGYSSGSADDKENFNGIVDEVIQIGKISQGGQILLSSAMHEALRKNKSIQSDKVDLLDLGGNSGLPDIYEIVWSSESQASQSRGSSQPAGAGESSAALAASETIADQKNKDGSKKFGRYEILEEIGAGGMGVVYKANDPTVGRIVALKTVRLDSVGPERDELIRRLRQEAQAAGRLEHPAIVTIYDAGEANGLFYLTMQYIEGKPLSTHLAERLLLPVPQILTIMEEICDGLHYAHERGIVHRDLKPGNIVLTPERKPKILDFGIAKITDTSTTKAGTVLGTPNYMSPEQTAGRRIDRRSDVFSLGSILYELLTGERAFAGNAASAVLHKIREEKPIPLRKIDPTLNPALERVVNKALAKDPFQRYQTCGEMKDDLAAVRSGQGMPEVPVQPPQEGYLGATVVMTPAAGEGPGTPFPGTPPPGSHPYPPATPHPGTPVPGPYGANPATPPTGTGLAGAQSRTPNSPMVAPASQQYAPGTPTPVPQTYGTGISQPKRSYGNLLAGLFIILLLGGGGYFSWQQGWITIQGLPSPTSNQGSGPNTGGLTQPRKAGTVTPPVTNPDKDVSPPKKNVNTKDTTKDNTVKKDAFPTKDTTKDNTVKKDAFPKKDTTKDNTVKDDTPKKDSTVKKDTTARKDNTVKKDDTPKKNITAKKNTTAKKDTGTALTEQQRIRVSNFIRQARNFMNNNRLDFAERRIKSALAIDPNNKEALGILNDIQRRRRVPR